MPALSTDTLPPKAAQVPPRPPKPVGTPPKAEAAPVASYKPAESAADVGVVEAVPGEYEVVAV
eukprot:CAMPEP_0182932218 /NCGR_PEP_ID=MMETSP0105_2-20130417/30702_1 /TAXON_ID=81532 ORGANISM="Acanthoeca-like sp., Strain 10tr" /NCGR_SAMPLE_ID=MMETSP0105_2 /ASSEMBLY_ACC=CAM_ASM_000205 /LENGTH=62 /DNA_ID=CAMNT_0025070777 /DNA_START=10 /DNA_END=194 /DNA_ORIENTATION=+